MLPGARLQQEGRITNVALADAVGLSPSPCLTPVKRLESDYGIEKYYSYVVIKSPFIKHHFPIQNLFGQTRA